MRRPSKDPSNKLSAESQRLVSISQSIVQAGSRLEERTFERQLDTQLQNTVFQFEHAHGFVEKITESSAQLAEALAGQQSLDPFDGYLAGLPYDKLLPALHQINVNPLDHPVVDIGF